MKKLLILMLLITTVGFAQEFCITGAVHTTEIKITLRTAADLQTKAAAGTTNVFGTGNWIPFSCKEVVIQTDPRQSSQTLYWRAFTNNFGGSYTGVVQNAISMAVPIVDGSLTISREKGNPMTELWITGGATQTIYTIIGKRDI